MCDASYIIKSLFSVHSEAIQIYMMDLIFFLLAKLGLTVVHTGIFIVQCCTCIQAVLVVLTASCTGDKKLST